MVVEVDGSRLCPRNGRVCFVYAAFLALPFRACMYCACPTGCKARRPGFPSRDKGLDDRLRVWHIFHRGCAVAKLGDFRGRGTHAGRKIPEDKNPCVDFVDFFLSVGSIRHSTNPQSFYSWFCVKTAVLRATCVPLGNGSPCVGERVQVCTPFYPPLPSIKVTFRTAIMH